MTDREFLAAEYTRRGWPEWAANVLNGKELTLAEDAALAAISTAIRSRSDLREKLGAAARSVVDNATGSYRARNGQQCYIEDGSGEAMMLIPHEDWHALEAALDAIATPITTAGDLG